MKYTLALFAVFSTLTVNSQEVTIDQMRTPTSPAFAILDETPSVVERPSSVQALSSAMLSAFASGQFKPGVALELTPFWMIKKVNYSLHDYLRQDAKGKDWGKLLLHHISFSGATSSTDSFVIGKIAPGLGTSYGIRILLFPGKASKETKADIDSLAASLDSKNKLQTKRESLLEDIDSYDTISSEILISYITGRFNTNEKSEADAIIEVIHSIEAELPGHFNDRNNAKSFIDKYCANHLPELYVIQQALADKLSSAREGFMWEVAVAGLSVFEDNKFSKGYFAKASVWSTISYRILVDEDDRKKNVDMMMLFRGIINDDVVDVTNYFDFGAKLQFNSEKWNLSAEYVRRKSINPPEVPSNELQPKDYTYRIVASFDYKINDLVGFSATFGKAFDGISTTFETSGEQSIIASGGLNVGFKRKSD